MSQHDYVIANDSGASVRADINSALQAILSQNSGTSEPTSTSAGTLWLDTTGGAPYTLKIRDAGNNHWLSIGSVTDPGSDGNLAVSAIEGTNVLSTGESGGNKFLREDGDGSCSWQTASAVLQVESALFNGVQIISTSEIDVTNLSCSMTITSGNKVLIFANLYTGHGQDDYGVLQITDGSNTIIAQNTTGTGSMINGAMAMTAYNLGNDVVTLKNQSINYLWTPGVTSITVKVRAQCVLGSNIYINRGHDTTNAAYTIRTISNLTIMEIQA